MSSVAANHQDPLTCSRRRHASLFGMYERTVVSCIDDPALYAIAMTVFDQLMNHTTTVTMIHVSAMDTSAVSFPSDRETRRTNLFELFESVVQKASRSMDDYFGAKIGFVDLEDEVEIAFRTEAEISGSAYVYDSDCTLEHPMSIENNM